MSEQTRSTFGPVQNLVQTLAASEDRLTHPLATVRFSRVYQSKQGVLLSAETGGDATAGAVSDGPLQEVALGGLEGSLLGHYFRLQRAERSLSDRARRKHRGGRRSAIRQIERERQRLGRDLHTGVGQMLAAIRLQVEVIGGQLANPPVAVHQALDRISRLAGDALEQVRTISRHMHPPEWQRLSLEVALQQLWDVSGIPQRFVASLDIHPLSSQPDPEVRALFYRAAQEALSNVIRHSQATDVRMSLETRQGHIVLTISDNGVGFNPGNLASAPANVASGIGLRSIREQAATIDGKLVMESGPRGTKLIVTVPFTGLDKRSD